MMAERYVRSEHVIWRRTSDAVVLLPAGSAPSREIVTLSGTGISLWELLREPVTVDEAAIRLADAYGADSDDVAVDIVPLLDELTRRCVVRAIGTA